MFNSLRQEFDPLDREILERAFDVAWATVKETERLVSASIVTITSQPRSAAI